MKKKIAGFRAVFGICAAIGWWGFLYPELTLTPDTYKIIREGNMACPDEEMEWDSEEDIYRKILEADAGQIRYKSRFLMELESLFERLK